MWRHGLDSAAANRHLGAGDPRSLVQKGRLAAIGLDELHPWHAEDREHQPGKPGAAAKIHEGSGCSGDQWQELCRVEKVAPPQIVKRCPARD